VGGDKRGGDEGEGTKEGGAMVDYSAFPYLSPNKGEGTVLEFLDRDLGRGEILTISCNR